MKAAPIREECSATLRHTLYCKKVFPSYGMHVSPVRTATGVAEEQTDSRQNPRSSMSPPGLPGLALPGLWKRAAPQSQATLQEQMVDLGRSTHSSKLEHQSPRRHISLREQYALPGQVETAGKVKTAYLCCRNSGHTSTCTHFALPIGKHPHSMTEKVTFLQTV